MRKPQSLSPQSKMIEQGTIKPWDKKRIDSEQPGIRKKPNTN